MFKGITLSYEMLAKYREILAKKPGALVLGLLLILIPITCLITKISPKSNITLASQVTASTGNSGNNPILLKNLQTQPTFITQQCSVVTGFSKAFDNSNYSEHSSLLENSYTTATIQSTPALKLQRVSGVVHSSFIKDAANANLSTQQVNEFVGIFADDINIKASAAKGDYFSVIYEAYYVGDKLIRCGNIVGAEYVSHGKAHRAIRFTDKHGHTSYYSPSGFSLHKSFMRFPLKFAGINSGFTTHRLDPVSQHFVRAHKGVDLKAPLGKPVTATGDGKIIFAAAKSDYGNTIMIQHNSQYQTLYAHLDHFAKGIHKGMYVKEGQLIGYVGATGRVTGPHLHYELLIDGTQHNPVTAALPHTKSVAIAYREKFMEKASELMEMFSSGDA